MHKTKVHPHIFRHISTYILSYKIKNKKKLTFQQWKPVSKYQSVIFKPKLAKSGVKIATGHWIFSTELIKLPMSYVGKFSKMSDSKKKR